jgi:hypothetical protein
VLKNSFGGIEQQKKEKKDDFYSISRQLVASISNKYLENTELTNTFVLQFINPRGQNRSFIRPFGTY